MAPRKAAAAAKAGATEKTAKTNAGVKKTAAPKKAAAATKKTETAAAAPAKVTKTTTKVTKTATKATTTKTATKTAAPKKAAASKKATQAAAAKTTKRKRDVEEESEEEQSSATQDEEEAPVAKRAKSADPKPAPKRKAAAAPKPAKKAKVAPPLPVINQAPTTVLDVFVFGEGSSGELGLGAFKHEGKKPIDVKRPRLNHNLKGVVQVSCGGMHAVALTNENKILSWGVNDQGALGRDTNWEGGLRDVDAEESDSEDEDDSGLNPRESTPAEVDMTGVPENTKWVQVCASDSATFALTDTGLVYGWGTFRSNEGIIGFNPDVLIQKTPLLVPELKKVTQLAAGSNHVIAMTQAGKILSWGTGEQGQLARRQLPSHRGGTRGGLIPQSIGNLPGRAKPAKLACGSYHCFVIDTNGRVIGWGLNNFAELAIDDQVGSDGGCILKPTLVETLKDYQVAHITGGEHHSVCCTEDGKLLTWGRIDGHQVGQPRSSFTEKNTRFDEKKNPRVLIIPLQVPNLENDKIIHVAAGPDHNFAVTQEGKVMSWGFSANYQTGQGTLDDVEIPTMIDNSAVRGHKVVWAGAGGQYSMLAALPKKE